MTGGTQGKRFKLLDLFCGAGGAAMGYNRAGFDIVGIDINPQPNYPFEFIQADAIEYLRTNYAKFDIIHASPPCQRYSSTTRATGTSHNHPDLLPFVRAMLKYIGKPYIIENVPGAPMFNYTILCGTMFNLDVMRHRWFEIVPNPILLTPPHNHYKRVVRQGYEADLKTQFMSVTGHFTGKEAAKKAMGIDWMKTTYGLAQAIPPAYTEFIGTHLLRMMNND